MLREGSRFEWRTFGLRVESRVAEFVPESRIGWFGDGEGMHSYHAWLLVDESPGCRVVMEEPAQGLGAGGLREVDPNGMHKGHDLWNLRLKHLAESTSAPG